MKRFILLTVMLLSVAIASAQEGKNVYNKYSGHKDVSAIYISPSMFRMIGNLPELEVDNGNGGKMDIAPLIKTFKGFYLLDISDKSVIDSINKDVADMMKTGKYEMLMELKDEVDIIQIFTAGNETTIDSFVFKAQDGESLQFICVDGAMDRSEFEKLMSSAMSAAK